MAKELLPDALCARIAPLLPPEPPKPKGGKPCRRPHKLHADKGYDYRHLRLTLRER